MFISEISFIFKRFLSKTRQNKNEYFIAVFLQDDDDDDNDNEGDGDADNDNEGDCDDDDDDDDHIWFPSQHKFHHLLPSGVKIFKEIPIYYII